MSEIIYLSVGGVKFETTLDTLCRDQNSMLAAMFSGRHHQIRNSKGYYFIDRDGKLFRYILMYLRTQELNLPRDKPQFIVDLLKEAEYFQLSSLINILKDFKNATETTFFTYKELLLLANSTKPIQAPCLNLSLQVLKFLDFTAANLQGCDFSYTHIYEVNFTQANLSFSKFDYSIVQTCVFIDAIFRKASCRFANFSGNDMKKCVFIESDFTKAKLGGADMRFCDLQSANLQDANLLVANMEGSNLLLANIKGANFEGANIKGTKGVVSK